MCVGGGVGTAVVYPIAQALAAAGVKVTSIIGGRSKEWVIYEDELRACGDVIVCTDDGSYGRPGFVTEALKDMCEAGGIDEVFAIGPVPMMRACSELTRPYGIKTTVSLNSIMIDGTGMCGGCRVSIDGKTRVRLLRRPRVRRPPGRLPPAGRSAEHLPRVRAERPREVDRGPRGGPLMSDQSQPNDTPQASSASLTERAATYTEPLPKKERMKIVRGHMPEQDAIEPGPATSPR